MLYENYSLIHFLPSDTHNGVQGRLHYILCRGLSVVGRLLFIYSRYCSFSLNIHNSRTDYFPKMRLAVHERKRFDVRCDIFALLQDFCLLDFFQILLLMQILIYFVRKVAKSSKHARGKAGKLT